MHQKSGCIFSLSDVAVPYDIETEGVCRVMSSFLNCPSGDWAQRHLTPGFAAVFSPACFVARLLVNRQILFDTSL